MHNFGMAALMFLTVHGIKARDYGLVEITPFPTWCIIRPWKALGLWPRASQALWCTSFDFCMCMVLAMYPVFSALSVMSLICLPLLLSLRIPLLSIMKHSQLLTDIARLVAEQIDSNMYMGVCVSTEWVSWKLSRLEPCRFCPVTSRLDNIIVRRYGRVTKLKYIIMRYWCSNCTWPKAECKLYAQTTLCDVAVESHSCGFLLLCAKYPAPDRTVSIAYTPQHLTWKMTHLRYYWLVREMNGSLYYRSYWMPEYCKWVTLTYWRLPV